jgi:hypothetical protein
MSCKLTDAHMKGIADVAAFAARSIANRVDAADGSLGSAREAFLSAAAMAYDGRAAELQAKRAEEAAQLIDGEIT